MAQDVATAASAQTASIDNLLAAFSWASYDYTLTFSDEVEYIWNKPLRSGSMLFLWVRYFGLASLAFKTAVIPGSIRGVAGGPLARLALSELTGFVLIFSVQVILQTRVYALYMSKALAFFNGGLFVAGIISTLALWGSSNRFECPASLIELASGCPHGYPMFWIPTVAFEGWIGALAMYKFLTRLRAPRPEQDGSDILSVFLRDSAIHYAVVILGVIIFNILGSRGAAPADSGFMQASVLVAGCRLVLHLRKAFYEDERRADERQTASVMVFRRASRVVDETFWGDDRPVHQRQRTYVVELTDLPRR